MRDRGFTLLEVLVALIIAAIGLGALFQGTLGGIGAATLSGRTQEAVTRARSRLSAVGATAPLVAGDRAGDDGGGYRWRERVAPLGVRAGEPGTPALFEVEVTISWGGRNPRSVTLDTRRLGASLPGSP